MFCPHPACYGVVGGMGLKKGFMQVRLRVGPNSRTWGKKEAEVKFGQGGKYFVQIGQWVQAVQSIMYAAKNGNLDSLYLAL